MPTNYPSSIDSYTLKVDGVSDVLAADTNNLQDAVVALQTRVGTTASPTFVTVGTTQTVTGTKTFSDKVTGRTSGNTDGLHAFYAPTTGGSFVEMWGRRGPFTTAVNHTGSSYAPALSMAYEYTGSYSGTYSIGHLTLGGANPGALTVHHINSSGAGQSNWQFEGASGTFRTNSVTFGDGTSQSTAATGTTQVLDAVGSVSVFFYSNSTPQYAGATIAGSYLFRCTTRYSGDTAASGGIPYVTPFSGALNLYGADFTNRTTAVTPPDGFFRTYSPTSGTWRLLTPALGAAVGETGTVWCVVMAVRIA